MRVLIEYVSDGTRREGKHVFVRPLDFVDFRVTSETTLGKCRVKSLGSPPRTASHEPMLTFILENRADLQRLLVGQEASVENIEIIGAAL